MRFFRARGRQVEARVNDALHFEPVVFASFQLGDAALEGIQAIVLIDYALLSANGGEFDPRTCI